MSYPHIWILISSLSAVIISNIYFFFFLPAFTADILHSAQRQTLKITHIKPQTRQHSAIKHPNLQVSQIPNPFSKLEIKAGLWGDKGNFSTACGKQHSLAQPSSLPYLLNWSSTETYRVSPPVPWAVISLRNPRCWASFTRTAPSFPQVPKPYSTFLLPSMYSTPEQLANEIF